MKNAAGVGTVEPEWLMSPGGTHERGCMGKTVFRTESGQIWGCGRGDPH